MSSGGALGMTFVEIVCSEFVVETAIAHDVVRDFENVVTDRNDCLLVAALVFDATVPRLERGPVAAGGRQAGLDQGATQVAPARRATAATPVARSTTADGQTLESADSDVRGRPIGGAGQASRAPVLDASTTRINRSEGPNEVLHRA
jgi:hypothetical protein